MSYCNNCGRSGGSHRQNCVMTMPFYEAPKAATSAEVERDRLVRENTALRELARDLLRTAETRCHVHDCSCGTGCEAVMRAREILGVKEKT